MKIAKIVGFVAFGLFFLSIGPIHSQPKAVISDGILPETEAWIKTDLRLSWARTTLGELDIAEMLYDVGQMMNGIPVDEQARRRLDARANSRKSSNTFLGYGDTAPGKRTMSYWLSQLNAQIKNGFSVQALKPRVDSSEQEIEDLKARLRDAARLAEVQQGQINFLIAQMDEIKKAQIALSRKP